MMKVAAKLVVSVVATAAIVLAARHGAEALQPAIPRNMPASARFVPSGFDLRSAEARGDWIACRMDEEQSADLCRVTDAHGTVIYQGEFLTVNGDAAVPDMQLRIAAATDESLWVDGPAGEGPVPVIPLVDGTLLAPAGETSALTDRWKSDPDELRRVHGL